MARRHRKLDEAVRLLQCYYNFVRPHSALPHSNRRNMRTPAMQANLVTRPLTLRNIFMSFGPRAKLSWLVDKTSRRPWNEDWRCALNNG
jgi:hypothetical protein